MSSLLLTEIQLLQDSRTILCRHLIHPSIQSCSETYTSREEIIETSTKDTKNLKSAIALNWIINVICVSSASLNVLQVSRSLIQ